MDMETTSPMDVDLIFVNSVYKNPLYSNLKGVKDDGDMMEKMLKNSYSKSSKRIHIVSNEDTNDIREKLQELKECPDIKGKQIQRLHFHFSGHGVHDRIEGDNCLVGSGVGSKLLSEIDLKNILLEWNSQEITMTVDCCRGSATLRGKGLYGDAGKVENLVSGWRMLSHNCGQSKDLGAVSKVSNMEKIFTLYATENKHTASDANSLTRELNKVTKEGENPILIIGLSKAVNDSWKNRGIDDQTSTNHWVQKGDNWANCLWPVGNQEAEEKESTDTSSKVPSNKELDSKINFLIFKMDSMEKKMDKENKSEKHEKVKRRATN